MDRISYSVMFERVVKSGHMTDEEFCNKYKYVVVDIDNFWGRKIPFDDPEQVEKSKRFARQIMESFKEHWASKGITPQNLLDYVGMNIGIPHTHWPEKYWLNFAKAVSGEGNLFDGIEEWITSINESV